MDHKLHNPFNQRYAGPAAFVAPAFNQGTAWNQAFFGGQAAVAARGAALWGTGQYQYSQSFPQAGNIPGCFVPAPFQHNGNSNPRYGTVNPHFRPAFNQLHNNPGNLGPRYSHTQGFGPRPPQNLPGHRGASAFCVGPRGPIYPGQNGYVRPAQSYRGNQAQPFVSKFPAIYCESCEKDFRNKLKYEDHVKKHVKCPKCDFAAIFDIVEEHFEIVHLPALSRKFKPPETEEDLLKWKLERKIRYPKVKQLVLATNRNGISKENVASNTLASEIETNPRDLSDGEIDEDGACDDGTVNTKPARNPLENLISCYGSDSDSDSGPDELPIVKQASDDRLLVVGLGPGQNADAANMESDRSQQRHFAQNNIAPVVPKVLPARVMLSSLSPVGKRRFPQPSFQHKRKPKTLFEKLKAQEMEKDNDMLLQCVAHICRNRFFASSKR